MATINTSSDLFGVAQFIVDASPGYGTHTTIQAAITSAAAYIITSGKNATVFVRPGTYTENIALSAGVNLTAFVCDAFTPNVTISGTLSFSGAGAVILSGLNLQSNGAAILSITGSSATQLTLIDCNLTVSFNPGITYSVTNTAANLVINNCTYNLSTTAMALYSMSSTGNFQIEYTLGSNSGLSKTASNNSAGTISYYYSAINNAISSSSTGALGFNWSNITTSALSDSAIVPLTYNGSGVSVCRFSEVFGGTASGISIGSGATLGLDETVISSTNTNSVTGAGTLNSSILRFSNTSSTINTAIQSVGAIQGIVANISGTAQNPSAGFIGERISSYIPAGSLVTVNSATFTNITSISLSAGVWDITGIIEFANGPITGVAYSANLSTTTASGGVSGDSSTSTPLSPTASSEVSLTVPNWRQTFSATTTNVFLVASSIYTVGTLKCYGRLSAVRVG